MRWNDDGSRRAFVSSGSDVGYESQPPLGVGDHKEGQEWEMAGFDPASVEEWRRCDFAPKEAEHWRKLGYTAKEAAKRREEDFSSQP